MCDPSRNLEYRRDEVRRPLRGSVALALWIVALTPAVAASQRTLLHESIPYDRITLSAANNGEVLLVKPLFPGRLPPNPLPRSGILRIRLVDRPGEEYELDYGSIAKIETFEELVLAQGRAKTAEGALDDAFECLAFLHEVSPNLDGLDEAYDALLAAEAERFREKGDHVAALARLRALFERDPADEQLAVDWGASVDAMAADYVDQGDFAAVRQLIATTDSMFPGHSAVERLEARLTGRASELVEAAEDALAEERFDDAYAKTRRAALVWPELVEIKTLRRTLRTRYPQVVVGVTSVSETPNPRSLTDWAGRRTHRLVRRSLVEFVGPAAEGGQYVCPLGQVTTLDQGRTVEFRLRDDVCWAGEPDAAMSAVDVAQTLLARSASAGASASTLDVDLLDRVAVPTGDTVQVNLRHAHVRPEALFCVDVWPRRAAVMRDDPEPVQHAAGGDRAFMGNGPYIAASTEGDLRPFRASPVYHLSERRGPSEIVERLYAQTADAMIDLRDGKIDVIDRINPWEVQALDRTPGITVDRYRLPLVHCLVPNRQRPLTARRDFRRALVYGIDREGILHALCGKKPPLGCRVVSGPMLAGYTSDDPLGYAYDAAVEPRPYNPILATALAEMTRQIARDRGAEQDAANAQEGVDAAPVGPASRPPSLEELVLAHPPNDIARVACTAIQRQLGLAGIPVRLVEMAGDTASMPEEADLWYVELAVWEPLIDTPRVLGPTGLAGGTSASINFLLRDLQETGDWAAAGRKLWRIHQVAHQELTLIPLWQMTDYFAYRDDCVAIPEGPVTLYQHVQNWRLGPALSPADSP